MEAEAETEGKFFYVRSRMNGFVLDVSDAIASPGRAVVMFPYHGGNNQIWFEDFLHGVIRSKLDENYVLQIEADTLEIHPFRPEELNQKLVTAGDRISYRDNPDRVIDIARANGDVGARVTAYRFHGGANQMWDFVHLPPAHCHIASKLHGKVIDVKGEKTDPGTKIVTYTRWEEPADNQIFWEDKYGYIHAKTTGFVIDTTEGSARMQPYDATLPGQQWVKQGEHIVNKADPTQVLGIKGEDDDNGAKLRAQTNSGKDHQKWDFAYIA